MAYDWSSINWRLIHDDDFSSYANQAAMEAAYPIEPLYYPTWGLTNSPDGGPGLFASAVNKFIYKQFVSPPPNGRFMRVIGRWNNTGTEIAEAPLRVALLSGPTAYNFLQTLTLQSHPSPGYGDDDLWSAIAVGPTVDAPGTTEVVQATPTIFPKGSTKTLEFRIAFSTASDGSTNDGAFEIFVDSVLSYSYEGDVSNWSFGTSPYWDLITFGPVRNLGPVLVYDSTVLVDDVDDVDHTIPCCKKKPPLGGDTGTIPDPVGTLPPWLASCAGGGVVDSVSDLSDGESWL